MASQIDSKTQVPFFSMILTMSMHHPYDKCEDHGFSLSDASLTPEYRNYLINCHFFDRQLEKYITALRKSGVYDKSVVVITADHHAHHSLLSMEEGEISEELPLYIVNGGIDQTTAWHGTCNQLDVYTTLLDLFGLTPQWRGFGHTLLKKDYRNSVTEEVQTFSEWIIRSDYFAGE
jgi:lipoteichoic acid synthase